MGKKPIVSVTYENETISIKKQLTLLKLCVTSLLGGPRVDLWPFYGFLCKNGFLFIERKPFTFTVRWRYKNAEYMFADHIESRVGL